MTIKTPSSQLIKLRLGVDLAVSYSPALASQKPSAPPLIFLHGGLGNRYNWRTQYEFAQAQGWEALNYDLAGQDRKSVV